MTKVSHILQIGKRRSFELYGIHMLFFISLSRSMTSTASALPVAFWTVGSCGGSAQFYRSHTQDKPLTFTLINTLYSLS